MKNLFSTSDEMLMKRSSNVKREELLEICNRFVCFSFVKPGATPASDANLKEQSGLSSNSQRIELIQS
jgi:hypothetical protein